MIIVIAIKVISEAVYEAFGVNNSTGWSVFYNFVDYLTWSGIMMHCVFVIKDKVLPNWLAVHRNIIRWLFQICGYIYATYAFIELTYIGTPYNLYVDAMGESDFAINHFLALGASMIAYVAMYKFKQSSKFYKWI